MDNMEQYEILWTIAWRIESIQGQPPNATPTMGTYIRIYNYIFLYIHNNNNKYVFAF